MEKLSLFYDSLEARGGKGKVPQLIKDNINPALTLREYQESAISRLVYYYEVDTTKKFPIELLFNMATGSGKTLIMAAAILYFFEKGYRNFVFFVDKTNIIAKTKDNFLNESSSKYLFNDRVVIHGKDVTIKEVETFSECSPDAINIHFSTIGGLHSRLKNPQENKLTLKDFEGAKTVFLSDEAHHINADTRSSRTKEEEANSQSWEFTVKTLVEAHKENILLEFTATIDWEDEHIAKKYKPRVVLEYDLKKFRKDKFSKDIFLLQSNAEIEDRMLQALVISQYRRKVAAKHKIALKPVILFKSKIIKESQEHHQKFLSIVEHMKVADLQRLKKQAAAIADDQHIFKKAFAYFDTEKIALADLVEELKVEFSKDRLVEVNSDEESSEKQLLVNTLESEKNEIRAIFAVDKLNEGWDVLNLFDIVRLYGTRDSGKPTTQEAQLVGRGARYFPFSYGNDEEKFTRKFDDDLTHELRVIEQLHFHSIQDHRYIAELRQALIKSGIHKEEGTEIRIDVKESFKKSAFYEKGVIWKNDRVPNKRSSVRSLADAGVKTTQKIDVESGAMSESSGFGEGETVTAEDLRATTIRMNELPAHVVRKALDRIPFFHFENLSKYFPMLTSIDEFIESENFLGGIAIEIRSANDTYSMTTLFRKLIPVFEGMKNSIIAHSSEFEGTTEFTPLHISEHVTDKTTFVTLPESGSTREFGRSMSTESRADLRTDIKTKDWYVYSDEFGTDEEKYFVKFLADRVDELKKSFAEVYLIRNQKIVELYDFKQGRRFEPDYLLFLGDGKKKGTYLQLFIEPKGAHIEAGDEWKQEFLLELKAHKSAVSLFEDDSYSIFGLPFYQEDTKKEFDGAFSEILK